MGEYAIYNGEEIKIGTCGTMYYLRYEDRKRVQPLPNSLNPATTKNLFWRIPLIEEDGIDPGYYEGCSQGYPLVDFKCEDLGHDYKTIQLHHECGMLINVPCYHGEKLPEVDKPLKAFWNGKAGYFYTLKYVKNLDNNIIKPIVGCRYCSSMWRFDWDDILPFIKNAEFKQRLINLYAVTEGGFKNEQARVSAVSSESI
jgi:hypothetical protein